MRLARQLTQCLETEDLREGADSYPLGLYCSWTRSELEAAVAGLLLSVAEASFFNDFIIRPAGGARTKTHTTKESGVCGCDFFGAGAVCSDSTIYLLFKSKEIN
jgi:hypothetical protein